MKTHVIPNLLGKNKLTIFALGNLHYQIPRETFLNWSGGLRFETQFRFIFFSWDLIIPNLYKCIISSQILLTSPTDVCKNSIFLLFPSKLYSIFHYSLVRFPALSFNSSTVYRNWYFYVICPCLVLCPLLGRPLTLLTTGPRRSFTCVKFLHMIHIKFLHLIHNNRE